MKLTINGIDVVCKDGLTILEAARDNGITIPTLCYLKDCLPIGTCRVCVVEIENSRTLAGACHTPATQGMVVYTDSPKVLAARRVIVELLLASHPDVCLICDKANLCELKRLAADLDIGASRFTIRKHYYPIEDENSYIIRDLSKCIMCRRCISACRNRNQESIFSVGYRGFESKIISGFDDPLGSEEMCRDCDACVSVCPTGALSKPRKYGETKAGSVLIIKE